MREMKNSGVAWVGAMPEEWTVKRGKFTLKLLNRPVKDTDDVITCFRDGEVTLRTNRRTDGFTFSVKEIGYQGIEAGDLVIHGMDGFAGSIGISDSRGKSSPVLVVCDTDENKRYIMYYLRSMAYNDVFTSLSTGIRVRSCDLRWNKLAELPYILPSFIEQDKIVSAIESSTSKVDVLIANVQAQIEKLKAYKQSLITEVVTKGLDPNAPMKDSGVEWIGKIPDSWNVSRIKYISDFGPTCDASKLTNDSIITYAPMECIKNGYFEPRSANYGALSHSLTAFQDGDIVLAKVTPCFENGNIAIMCDLDSNYGLGSSELFVLRPRTIHTRYFFYWLQNRYFLERGRATMTGTGGLKRVSPTFVKGCYIHIPPRPEQEKIADVLDTKCAQINRFISLKESKIEKLQQYKRSLIYEYVTGKKEVV